LFFIDRNNNCYLGENSCIYVILCCWVCDFPCCHCFIHKKENEENEDILFKPPRDFSIPSQNEEIDKNIPKVANGNTNRDQIAENCYTVWTYAQIGNDLSNPESPYFFDEDTGKLSFIGTNTPFNKIMTLIDLMAIRLSQDNNRDEDNNQDGGKKDHNHDFDNRDNNHDVDNRDNNHDVNNRDNNHDGDNSHDRGDTNPIELEFL